MEIESSTIETFMPNWIVICKHISLFVNHVTGQSIQCHVCDIQYAVQVLEKGK
jgi:hypothetical protein